MRKVTLINAVIIALTVSFNVFAQEIASSNKIEVVLASEIKWEQLNPKRGDASPKAANIWGDRKNNNATGFLVKFVDGFSSPPHIHNVTYRGIVLSGLVHNDDPNAQAMWMPKGSYWTQPAGESHITSAVGNETIAYIEIEAGPYLVLPTDQAFDEGERPINVDASNLVWLNSENTNWLDANSKNNSEISFLWGKPIDGEMNGSLLKLPTGFTGNLVSNGSIKVVIIDGVVKHAIPNASKEKALNLGSYFGSDQNIKHQLSCKSKQSCIVYVRSFGKYTLTKI